MKKVTLIVLAVLAGIYLLVCAAVYTFQKRIIFLPGRSNDPPPGDLNIREVYFPTADGQILHAWWMPVDSSKYTVLFFHGNAGCVARGEERMRFFRELGYSTLMIDYRGYGKSTGSIEKETDIYEDGKSALKFVADSLKIPDDRLIVWGWSLGGAVATEVSQQRPLAGLVLEGTFFSMDEIAARSYPIFPTRWLLRFHFRSGEKIANMRCPVFFIHSKEDLTIPYGQGKRLFDAAKERKSFLDISGSHNHGYYENRDKIINALQAFMEEKP
jgi:fermentation-respiration switch protein FrsA (DUF1100 family)